MREKASECNRDGLRAVAHSGSKAGISKYIKSQVKYNLENRLGCFLCNVMITYVGDA